MNALKTITWAIILLGLSLQTFADNIFKSSQKIYNSYQKIEISNDYSTINIERLKPKNNKLSAYLGVGLNTKSPLDLTGHGLSFSLKSNPMIKNMGLFVRLNGMVNGKETKVFEYKRYKLISSPKAKKYIIKFDKGTEKDIVSLNFIIKTDNKEISQFVIIEDLKIIEPEDLEKAFAPPPATKKWAVSTVQKIFNLNVDIKTKYPFNNIVAVRKENGNSKSSDNYIGTRLLLENPTDLRNKQFVMDLQATPEQKKTSMFIRFSKKVDKKVVVVHEYKVYNTSLDGINKNIAIDLKDEKCGRVDFIDIIIRTECNSKSITLKISNIKVQKMPPPPGEIKKNAKQYLPTRISPKLDSCKVIYSHLTPELKEEAKKCIKKLEKKWGKCIEEYTHSDKSIRFPAGNYVVFSNGVKGPLANSLFLRKMIQGKINIGEVKVVHDFILPKVNIIYVGGSNVEAIKSASDALYSANLDDYSGFRFSQAEKTERPTQEYLNERVAFVEKSLSAKKGHNDAIRAIYLLAVQYQATGYEEYAKATIDAIKILSRDYEKAKSWRKTPPTFRAQELVVAGELLDESKSFTKYDRLILGNLLSLFCADTMNFWEMVEPLEIYRKKETKYLINHPLFASRSVYLASIYLTKRFRLPIAKFWAAVADNAFAEMAKAPQGFEDSGDYQVACIRIFIDHCYYSGNINFLNDNFRKFVDLLITTSNHLGYGASYGDTPPLKSFTNWNIFETAALNFDDTLAGYLYCKMRFPFIEKQVERTNLKNKPYTPRLLGLNTVAIADYFRPLYKINPQRTEVLNKASFRSGFDDDDETLILGGINGGHHGHMDANSIIEFSRGYHFWLIDGHYIRTFQDDHNTLMVSCDANTNDYRREVPEEKRSERFSDIIGKFNAPNHERAILQIALNNYANTNWKRSILWNKKDGFWVFDNIKALKNSDFFIRSRFRTLGEVEDHKNFISVTQIKSEDKNIPNRMFIVRGDENSLQQKWQHDHAEGEHDYFAKYPYADKYIKVIDVILNKKMEKDNEESIINFFHNPDNNSKVVPEMRSIGKNARIISRGKFEIGAINGFEFGDLAIKANAIILDEKSLTAHNISYLKIGEFTKKFSTPIDLYCKWQEGCLESISQNEIKQILAKSFANAKKIEVKKQQPTQTITIQAKKVIDLDGDVQTLATSNQGFAAGLNNGKIQIFDNNNKLLSSSQIDRKINKIIQYENNWIYGTNGSEKTGENWSGKLGLLDNNGKVLWSVKTPGGGATWRLGFERSGKVVSLIKLNRKDNTPLIVVGLDSWQYMAFDVEGKYQWTLPILHGAGPAVAGDLNNDGNDEFAVGTEYPFNHVGDINGKKINNYLSDRGDRSVAFDDRQKLFLFGRDDSYIKAASLGQSHKYVWSVNVGGEPLAILPLNSTQKTVVGTSSCALVFLGIGATKEHYTNLSGEVVALVEYKKSIYAACRDGWVYRVNTDGKITGNFLIENFKVSLNPITLNVRNDDLLVGFGNKIYVLN